MVRIAPFILLLISLKIVSGQDTQECFVLNAPTWLDTRFISSQSSRVLSKNESRFRIDHRFGQANEGFYDIFGLDDAQIRLGLEYGLTDKLCLGVGRSSQRKMYDAFVKSNFYRSKKLVKVPFELTFYSDIQINSERWAQPNRDNFFSSRLSYSFQLIASFMLGSNLCVQISPSLLHRNLVETINEKHDVLSIGYSSSWRLNQMLSLSCEYYWVLNNQLKRGFGSPLMLSVNLHTSGHVFQLVIGNAQGLNNSSSLSETTAGIDRLYLGFNISRAFSFKNRKPTSLKE